ncbi:MAG: hypothetical protein COS85_24585 [Armatimonadetes bacterium CG07_land_8_20_14_0_80_59_28]|nr:MAG: hypothetical protein COS85_24585 [Armatimonadetes bacterium CG07_land_8_20_14_0_80_59_28]PIX39364.1 MAG: hypothetical protein COZ56_17800 [Armatimonadetes bacterium CG_4_8_14_3_um_filter_58_9]
MKVSYVLEDEDGKNAEAIQITLLDSNLGSQGSATSPPTNVSEWHEDVPLGTMPQDNWVND